MTDQFTTAVVQAALDSAAEEMFEVLRKTAMSPIIYEVLDVGTGITAADGALVSSGAGIPSFVGVLDKSVKAILAKEGDRVAEGDVFLTNDPNFGGVTHLNDVVVAEPVFFDGACIAWVASIAHWGDIGGTTAKCSLIEGGEAREISGEMIVTAPCAASCEIAASLANRFGVIVGRRKWVDQMKATATRPWPTSSGQTRACPISSPAISGRRSRPGAAPRG